MKRLLLILTILISGVVSSQSFDFDCEIDTTEIEDIVKEFFAEPDYNWNKHGQLDWFVDFYNFYNDPGSKVVAYAQACYMPDDYYINIGVNLHWWDQFDDRQKKFLIYHELGHDVLNLGHVCIVNDIMATGDPETCTLTWPTDFPVYDDAEFEAAKTRMFAGTDQVPQDCTASKGGTIRDIFPN